jgi:hypothetical protein
MFLRLWINVMLATVAYCVCLLANEYANLRFVRKIEYSVHHFYRRCYLWKDGQAFCTAGLHCSVDRVHSRCFH